MQNTIKLSLISVALLSSLNAQDVKLETITVTSATKSKQSVEDVTSNINIITSEEIEEKRYTTVTQALNSVSGINFTQSGGMGSTTSVMVRGFDSKRVLVLIDGVRYNDITSIAGAPFAHIMMSDIKQIEIVKGAQSGIWGADATAGVINIITKSAKKGLHGSISAEYGSYNTQKYGASASYKTDIYSLKISSQTISTDGFSAKVPDGGNVEDFEDDGYENTTTNIKLGVNFNETNSLSLSHTIIDADLQYDKTDADSYATAQTKDSFSNITFNHVDSFNELDIFVNKSLFDRDYPEGYTKEFDGEVYEYGIKSKISYLENDFFIVGADYKTYEHLNSIEQEYNNKAGFITNSNIFEKNLNGSLILTESLRADNYDKFDNEVTGKIGTKYRSNSLKEFSISANIGTAYNVPTLYQLYAPAGYYGAIGNENLTPENTTSYDIGVAYKDIKLTYFYNTIEDMIDYTDHGYDNLEGESKIQGIEIEYATDIYEDIFITANYTYLDTEDSNGEELQRRPKDTLKAAIDYYGIKNLHLGLNGEYIGERFQYSYGTYDKSAQTGKYTLVNFIVNYDLNKYISLYTKVDNLTDKEYQIVDGYATAERSYYIGLNAQY